VALSVVALAFAIVGYSIEADDLIHYGVHTAATAQLLYILFAKISFLSLAVIGIVAWYLRWLNRWFEQHAAAEFNLKQFELDVDRASWVVETSMEWRASEHGVIPSHLLDSITRNLFSRHQAQEDASWPAPGFEDTEIRCFYGTGGGSWRDGSLRESSSLRQLS
jgi:hypothetical protein